jgi:hypothetical protein
LRFAAMSLVTAVAAPASALAASGGTGLPGGSGGQTAQPRTSSGVTTETVSGGGITFTSRSAALLRGTLWLNGTSAAGKPLVIQLQSGGTWTSVATASPGANGSFTAAWHPTQTGTLSLRAATANGSAASPAVSVLVYRPSIATEYGPGFYGHKTACGTVLRRATIGVANRTLPCGSPVSIYYRGRMIVVPVIDRGPYANHANWDLTMATGRALGIYGTTTIGAVRAAVG